MYRLGCFIAIILIFITSISSSAKSGLDSGLEVGKNSPVYVLVEKLTEKEKGIGLTDELIRNKVELRLRQNNIKVGTEAEGFEAGMYLYIYVGVTGGAYSVNVGLHRLVNYSVGFVNYKIFAEAYNRSGQGIHDGNFRLIIDSILHGVDIFSGDFLRVNSNYTE